MVTQPQNPLVPPPPPIGVQNAPQSPSGWPAALGPPPANYQPPDPSTPPEPVQNNPPQFTGAGSDRGTQADLALGREFDAQRQAQLGSNATFDADLRRRSDETFAEFERSLNPQWEARAREFEQSLVGRGIDPNSEAGRNARAEFDRGRTDAFSQARRAANADGVALQQQRWQQQFAIDQAEQQARNAGLIANANQSNLDHDRSWRERQFNEDTRRYDQGFGEDSYRWDQSFDQQSGNMDFQQMMALMGFDQGTTMQNNMTQEQDFSRMMQMLGFMPQGGPVGVDVSGAFGQESARNQGNAANAQAARNAQMQAAASIAMRFMTSDARVKDEIRQVGTLHNGLPVYAYKYKSGGPTHIGVMAQDVEAVKPDAVIEVNGIKMVNYDMAVQ